MGQQGGCQDQLFYHSISTVTFPLTTYFEALITTLILANCASIWRPTTAWGAHRSIQH